MSSAPVVGAAFERYQQQRGGGGAAAANGSTVRSARFLACACVPGLGGGFGAVLVSDADGFVCRVGGR